MPKTKIIVLTLLVSATLACNALIPTVAAEPTPTMVVIVEPAFPPPQPDVPLTEAGIPRVSVEEARAALESGAAIIVDVRSADAYAVSHIAGAVNIPLGEIETNPTGLNLDTEQWIVTYCT